MKLGEIDIAKLYKELLNKHKDIAERLIKTNTKYLCKADGKIFIADAFYNEGWWQIVGNGLQVYHIADLDEMIEILDENN